MTRGNDERSRFEEKYREWNTGLSDLTTDDFIKQYEKQPEPPSRLQRQYQMETEARLARPDLGTMGRQRPPLSRDIDYFDARPGRLEAADQHVNIMRKNAVLNLMNGKFRAYVGGDPIGDFGSTDAAYEAIERRFGR